MFPAPRLLLAILGLRRMLNPELWALRVTRWLTQIEKVSAIEEILCPHRKSSSQPQC
jgi:hypothetical protein